MNKETHNFLKKTKQQNLTSCHNSDFFKKLELLMKKRLHNSRSIKSAMTKIGNSTELINTRSQTIKNAKHIINNWQQPSKEVIAKIITKISKDIIK